MQLLGGQQALEGFLLQVAPGWLSGEAYSCVVDKGLIPGKTPIPILVPIKTMVASKDADDVQPAVVLETGDNSGLTDVLSEQLNA